MAAGANVTSSCASLTRCTTHCAATVSAATAIPATVATVAAPWQGMSVAGIAAIAVADSPVSPSRCSRQAVGKIGSMAMPWSSALTRHRGAGFSEDVPWKTSSTTSPLEHSSLSDHPPRRSASPAGALRGPASTGSRPSGRSSGCRGSLAGAGSGFRARAVATAIPAISATDPAGRWVAPARTRAGSAPVPAAGRPRISSASVFTTAGSATPD